MDPARKQPTLADLDALPPDIKGEIIEGVLYTMTRPRAPHQHITLSVGSELKGPFADGRGGPGGWWVLTEPGIELPNTPRISPDLAAWRRERLPVLPRERAINVAPDWVCEILSPATRRYNLLIKRPYYARIGVNYQWRIDLDARVVTAYHLESSRWVELGVWGDETEVRIEPFDAISINVARWWA